MDARKGVVRDAVNLDWHDLPLGSLLEKRYELPVYIANDCQAAALAECTFGSARNVSNLVLIRVGRGIGAGVVLNRSLYYGDGFGAGEIGHVKVVDGGELCRCGHYGCLETVVSSRAIVMHARAIARSDPTSSLHRYAQAADEIDLDAVFRVFQTGDKAIEGLIANAGDCLGRSVAHLVCALNIQRIVLAGSMARFGQVLIDPVREQVRRGALAALAEDTQVEFTTLDPHIVILGAAALLLAYELELV
jgi:predicted NBD/HSP70 family sugar kinase